METNSLAYKTLKNSAYTFINYVFPILFSVFITPVVVRKLGVEDYGIYILVNTITAFLSLLDLGLGVALVKYISQYIGERNEQGLKDLINSAYSLYFVVGILGFVVYAVLGKFFLPIFKIGGQSQQHIMVVFLLSGALFVISSLSQLFAIIPAALQRFDITTKVSLGQLTIFNVGVLIAVLLGYKLKVILALNIVTSAGMALVFMTKLRELLPQVKVRLSWNKQEITKAYKFGLLAATNNLASNSLIQLDRFIVPIFLGPSALSYYSLPGNVAQKTSGISASVVGVVFPMASTMIGAGDSGRLREIYVRVMRNITVVAAACTAAIVTFAYPILYYWLGKEFAERGWQILIILALTYFLLALYTSLTSFLLGMNRIKFLLGVSCFLALLNLILLLILVKPFGIIGAAWAYLGGVMPVPLIFYWAEKHFFGLNGQAKIYAKFYAKLLLTSVVFYAVGHFGLVRLVNSFASLVVIGPLAVIIYFLMYWAFGFMDKEDQLLLYGFWGRIKGKFLSPHGS